MVIFTIFPLTELKAYIRKLDHETSDLKFLNNQYVHKVRSLEQDSKAKTERILQLQEKNMQAVVQTPGWLADTFYLTLQLWYSSVSVFVTARQFMFND